MTPNDYQQAALRTAPKDLPPDRLLLNGLMGLNGEAGIGYGSINHPVDRDPVCGYNGIINDTCPCCGRSEADGVPFERIRRITGYLVGTLDKWNDAKRAEERDRVKHEVDSNFGD